MNSFVLQNIKSDEFSPLDEKETLELFKINTKEAREKIIKANISLVKHAINKYFAGRINSVDKYDDVFQEGIVGLVYAVNNYDISKNVKFSSYAVSIIDGYIKTYLRTKCRVISYGRKELDLLNIISNISETYEKKYNRKISISELSILLNIAEDEINMLNAGINVESIYIKDDDGIDFIKVPDFVDDIKECELIIVIKGILESYSIRNKNIILDYINGETNQRIIGEKYDITQAQISRILNKFKKDLSESYDYNKVEYNKPTNVRKYHSKDSFYNIIDNYNEEFIDYSIITFLSYEERNFISLVSNKIKLNKQLSTSEMANKIRIINKLLYKMAIYTVENGIIDKVIKKEKIKTIKKDS